MTQPIKKKYVGDNQIDGNKVLLEQGQSIIGLNSEGLEAPLIGFDQNDNVLIGGSLVTTSVGFENEQAARIAADEAINTRIDNLLSNLDPEAIDSFTEVVAELQTQQANLVAVDEALQLAISNEEQRATAAEQLLQQNIDTVQSNLDTEEQTRIAEDQALNARIDSILSNLDPEAIDSFTEVVAELQAQQANLVAVDQALQASIAAEEARALSAEEVLQQNIDTVQSNLDVETQARIAEDQALNSRIDSVLSNLDPEAIDSFTEVVAELQTQQANLVAVDQALQASIAAEEARAINAEELIANNLAQEILDRAEADSLLQSNIDTLDVYAQEIRSDLDALDIYAQEVRTDLDNEISNRINSIASSLQEAKDYTDAEVLIEKNRAETAETTIQSNLDAETQARILSDDSLSSRIDTLEQDPVTKTYVDTGVTGLQTQINNIISNTDPDALDSLTEIVEAFQAADENINQLITDLGTSAASALASAVEELEAADAAIQAALDEEIESRESLEANFNSYVASNDAALALETSERVAADLILQSNIDAESSRATDAENNLQSAITQEIVDRIAADTILQDNIDAEEEARIIADQNLQNQVDTLVADLALEVARAEGAEDSLQSQIVQEIQDRETADLVLQNNIDAEETARIAADNVLQANIEAEALRATNAEDSLQSQITQEITDRQNAVSDLQDQINDEVSRATATESNLQDQITTNLNEFNSYVSSNDSRSSSLETRLDTAEQDILDLQSSDQNLQSQIDANLIFSQQTQSDLDALEIASAQADSALSGRIDILELDPVTKTYVDSLKEGLSVKPAVKAATTEELAGVYDNGVNGVGSTITLPASETLDIDGVTAWSLFDGILVKNQSNQGQNGRYFISQLGDENTSWVITRCGLCDEVEEIISMYVWVQGGDTQQNTGWVAYVGPDFAEVGVDPITWFQFSGAGAITAGFGLQVSGSEFSVKLDGETLSVSNAGIKISEIFTSALDTRFTNIETDVDTLQQDIVDAESRLDAAENRLDIAEPKIESLEIAMGAVEVRVDTLEAEMDTAESRLDNLESDMSTAQSDIQSLETNLAAETQNREQADTELQSNIDTLDVYAQETRADLDALDVYTQEVRSDLDDLSLSASQTQDALLQEIQDRIDGDAATLISANSYTDQEVAAEATIRQSADEQLQSNIDAENTRAVSAENDIASNLAAEITNREQEDLALDNKILTEKNRIDAILDQSESDKDSFAKIVTFINSVDAENDQQFNDYVAANDAALAQEISERISGDNELSDRIDVLDVYAQETRSDLDELDVYAQETRADLDDLQSFANNTQTALEQEIQDRIDGDIATLAAAQNYANNELSSQKELIEGAELTLFEDMAAVYADGQPGAKDPSGRDGWYFESKGTGDEINWYFLDGTATPIKVGELNNLYAIANVPESTVSPFIMLYYTARQNDGQDAGSWFRTRIAMVPVAPYIRGVKALFYTGSEPSANLHPELPRVQLQISTTSTVGPNGANEQIITATLGSNSLAGAGEAKFTVNRLGIISSVFQVEYDLAIRSDFTLSGLKQLALNESVFREQTDLALKAAEINLTNLIDIERSERQADVADLGQSIVAVETSLSSTIAAETQARENADIAIYEEISTQVGYLLSNTDPDLLDSFSEVVAAFQAADEDLNNAISALGISASSALASESTRAQTAEADLQNQINAEVSRATAAENTIAQNLATETSNRQAAVLAEEQARIAADQDLQTQINNILSNTDPDAIDSFTEVVAAFAQADQNLNNAITNLANAASADLQAESTRAQGAESNLQDQIDTLTNTVAADVTVFEQRLITLEADPVTKTYVDTEVDDLQGQINFIISNSDPAALDSLTEIVAAYQAADSNLQNAISILTFGISGQISAEQTARINADNTLSSRITVLENRNFAKKTITIDSEFSFIDLDHNANVNSIVGFKNRLPFHKDHDYTTSVVSGKTRLTWIGDFAAGQSQAVQAADKIFLTYYY